MLWKQRDEFKWQNTSAAMLADRGMPNSRGEKKKVDIPYFWYFFSYRKLLKPNKKLQICYMLFWNSLERALHPYSCITSLKSLVNVHGKKIFITVCLILNSQIVLWETSISYTVQILLEFQIWHARSCWSYLNIDQMNILITFETKSILDQLKSIMMFLNSKSRL